MRQLFWVLCLISYVALADETCEALKETVVQVTGLPQTVTAGRATQEVVFSLTDYQIELLKQYDTVVISSLFKNAIPGAYAFQKTLEVKFAEDPFQATFRETVNVPKTAIGKYELSLFLQAFSKSKRCFGALPVLAERVIEVRSPGGADVHPPVVTSAKFEKETASIGDEVTLSFSLTDKENSEICTGERHQEKACLGNVTFHLELESQNAGSIHVQNPFEQTKPNLYQLTFTVPKETKPGTYRLKTLNVFDIHGNGSHHPTTLEKEASLQVLSR